MKFALIILIPIFLLSDTSFITKMEYASQLYKNPRGIGCQYCHGDEGGDKLIANYRYKNKKKSFRGPAINKLDFNSFFKALSTRKRGMPRYFLTTNEIKILYFYLQKKKIK